jgi:pimeloyl-ACP methyl ester carboxylesterase
MDIFADDLISFLDGLEITQPVVVCGLSMGGYTAFTFYRKYSERMAGLILTATRAAGDSPQKRDERDAAAAKALNEGSAVIIAGMLPKLFSPNTYVERPELTAQVTSIMESTSVYGVVGDLLAMKGRQDSTGILPEINIPTLVIHGVDDQIVPLDEAQQMAAAIPNASLEIIPGAGHLPNLERPDLFNASICNFLESFD